MSWLEEEGNWCGSECRIKKIERVKGFSSYLYLYDMVTLGSLDV